MHISSRSVRIIAAALIAVVMVGASFWFTNATPKLASALSTDELLRAYVEQDTDGDGLPDWQEEVYGTDPGNAYSVSEAMTDLEALQEGLVKPAYESEAVPLEEVSVPFIPGEEPATGSLTEQFSQQFAQAYFAAGGGKNVSESEQQRIINDLLAVFVKEAEGLVASPYTELSVRTDREADFDEYTDALATIFIANDLPVVDADPLVLTDALMQGDKEAVKKLVALGNTYTNIQEALLALRVPREMSGAHLSLIRGFDTLARILDTVVEYETDPLAALGGLSALDPASDSIVEGFRSVASIILSEGEPREGTGAAMIVRIARSAEQP